jgi:hypothetical protein
MGTTGAGSLVQALVRRRQSPGHGFDLNFHAGKSIGPKTADSPFPPTVRHAPGRFIPINGKHS